MKNLTIFTIVCGLFLLSYSKILSQLDDGIIDNKGTDFYLAFPPNYHNNATSNFPELRNGDTLHIIVLSDQPVNGIIDYRNRNGIPFSDTFSIANNPYFYDFKIPCNDFEVFGYNSSGEILSNNDPLNQCEKIGKNSFHITTDTEVSVIAHSQAVTTSESCIVLPTEALGRQYLIMSYNSDGYGNSLMGNWNEISNSTPSQFLIVATKDSTMITIKQKVSTHINIDKEISIVLNQGEVYLVQTKIKENDLNPDLSGSEIISDKPVAVFSGHQRATIPLGFDLGSRDFIVEQLVPVNFWGREAIVFPIVISSNSSTIGGDRFRVLFSEDSSNLIINDTLIGVFSKTAVFDSVINCTKTIHSSEPVSVAVFKQTSQDNFNGNTKPNSDPFMMLITPNEHFINQSNIFAMQAFEYETTNSLPSMPTGRILKVYSKQYIAIIAKENSLNSIFIDSLNISDTLFKPVAYSNYYFANIPVNEGCHKVASPDKIGVYAYGFGYANGYAYNGGFNILTTEVNEKTQIFKGNSYLFENYPNPVVNTTNIHFSISEQGFISLKIYDILGNLKLEIISNKYYSSGDYNLSIDMNNLASGIYIYSLTTNDKILVKTLIKQ